MRTIPVLATQPWVEYLGLTLLHFLWQGLVIAAIYAAVRRYNSRALGPNGRYLLACAALAAMSLAPVVTWVAQGPLEPAAVAGSFTAPMPAARTWAAPGVLLPLPDGAPAGGIEPFLSWVVALWLIGATVFSLRLCGAWMLAERLRWRMARLAPVEWQHTLDRLKARIPVSRPVRLLVSGLLDAPAAVGWLRPIVLVPAGALAGLPPAQIEALLLHELAHIRRHDYVVQLLQTAIEAVFFYHPAVWWISGHMRAERELCCDDVAVSITGDARDYARALAEFDAARWSQPAVVAANGGSLAGRIARLLGQSSTPRRASGPSGAAPALILAAVGAWAMFAQPAVRPQFEVASVKQSFSESLSNVRALPGRLTGDASLQVLLQHAYGLQPSQVVGGPGWMQSERFQVDARTDAKATREQMFLMLQSLLEDRFQLKTHRETKDMPVYLLVAARSGFQPPPPKEGTCVEAAADAAPAWVGGRMAASGELPPAKSRCGSAGLMLGPAGARLQGGKIGMPALARTLSLMLDRPVIDRTGFTGTFDVQVDFLADETTPTMPPPPPGSGMSGPSFPQALRQQMGLQLETAKGPVEVMVVDRAERPTAN